MDDQGGADPADRGPVDWDLAVRIARRGSRPGPTAGRVELSELVAELRELAGVAAEHAARISRLRAVPTVDAPGVPAAPHVPALAVVQVVDRGSWASANIRLLRTLAGPALAASARTGSGSVRTSLSRATGAAQVGGLLAALSGKVLGQFDPFTADARAPYGRLLLVAPNILGTERSLGVVPRDFRLWVALHEQTHALQFAAAPWLADHLRTRSAELLADLTGRAGAEPDGSAGEGRDGADGTTAPDGQDPDGAAAPAGGRPLHEVLTAVVRAVVRPGGEGPESGRGVAGLLTPAQRETFDQVSAVMALLEGHADVTMDGVGRTVVPSVRRIRARFEARRDAGASAGGLQRVLREALGLDAKLAQYRDGAGFVRAVRREVGTEGFNAVWTGPEQLPTAAEIHDAGAWVRRVHG
ncbi:zinc-dependent metalloprotease [Cellulomonas hominis]